MSSLTTEPNLQTGPFKSISGSALLIQPPRHLHFTTVQTQLKGEAPETFSSLGGFQQDPRQLNINQSRSFPGREKHRKDPNFLITLKKKKIKTLKRKLHKKEPLFHQLHSRAALPGATSPRGTVIHLNVLKLLSRRDCFSCRFSPHRARRRRNVGQVRASRGDAEDAMCTFT